MSQSGIWQLPLSDGLPNVVIAGAVKCGTTSLFTYLSSHPDISSSSVKETLYFSAARYRRPLPPLRDYRQFFRSRRDERVVLEASPGYIYGGDLVTAPIRDILGEPLIVMMLRDPVTRLESFFGFYKEKGILPTDMSLAEYVDTCYSLTEEDFFDQARFPYHGLAGGRYADYLPSWSRAFPNSVHVIFFEDFTADPEREVRRLLMRLGLNSNEFHPVYSIENRTLAVRRSNVHRTALRLNSRFEPWLRKRPALKRALRTVYQSANSLPRTSEITPALQERLDSFFHSHNDALREQLAMICSQESLPDWLRA